MADAADKIEYDCSQDDWWWVKWPRDMSHYCSSGRNQVVCGGLSVLECYRTVLLRIFNSKSKVSSIVKIPLPKEPEALRAIAQMFSDIAEKIEKEKNN